MAFVHGKNSKIYLGGTNISSYVDSVTFERSVDSHDVTTFGKESHVKRGGLIDGSMTISGTLDNSTGATSLRTLGQPGSTTVEVVWGPGSTSGYWYTFSALKQSWQETVAVADMAKFSISLELSSTLTVSTSS